MPSLDLPVDRNLSLDIAYREHHYSQHRRAAIVGCGQRWS